MLASVGIPASETELEIRIENLRVNPPIDDRLFSAATLESGRPID